MKCACGKSICKNEIIIGPDEIWIRHETLGENELLLYVDAKALEFLVIEARRALMKRVTRELPDT
ncbi:MAG: hypothetical protein QME60_08430 [Verrucomicrobiota bacterium]|nr:hypothetical protein [Verrucomicrobiota bacterium]